MTTPARKHSWQVLWRSLRNVHSTGTQRLLLAAGYGASLLTTAFIIWLIIATPGTAPIAQTSQYLLILVCLNLALLLGLLYFVVRRVINIARSRGADAGARLHLRYVFLFSMAAVLPAIVVASAFLFINRGLDTWFSDRVRGSVENGAQIAKIVLQDNTRTGGEAMEYIHSALSGEVARSMFSDRLAYAIALKGTLDARAELSAVYIIDKTGQVLVRAEEDGTAAYLAPPQAAFDEVTNDGPKAWIPAGDAMRFLYPLEGYNGQNGAFLYGIKPLPAGLFERMTQADQAIIAYRDSSTNKIQVQGVFAMAYLEAVLLVLVGAIWGGTSAAESIATPVARLVQAADKVASGDLNARVMTHKQSEDIAVLSRAFNRMTSDLQSQQLALSTAREEAEARSTFIETVLSEISAGIVGIDAFEHISAINRHAASFLGVVSDDAIGVSIRDLAPEITELLDKVSVHRVEEQEVDLVRKGETRRVRVRVSGLETGGSVLTFDDITRLISAQRNAAWRDVARRIAHEIKNPLTPIQLSAERLRKKYRAQIATDGETFERLTDTIVRQVGDIGRMVDEFSSFARMPAPNFSEEDAPELLRAAVFAQRVARADIAIDIIEPLPELHVICDGRLLSQALGNVLKNACEAVSSRLLRDNGVEEIGNLEGPAGHLRVEMTATPDFVTVMVEDDGIGLPEKDRDRLTEPYVTTREKGTGLGLAIVKRILEDHGGDFFLSDAEHLSGARATLRLPRLQAGAPPVDTQDGASSAKLMRV
ncbi:MULTISPECIES: PAS domain-containing sensor histidine kinase [Asticcacaulis]|uniref:sensor histidine kinase n=1 Tax=Asticcacaulis TaxID=76890 RepID=UPI001AE71380|nr:MULTISPECIES: PAS domain-containing sensor histidine kinase [Asticcacaulis]MBP2158290.1 two-component system nitrogen regulation sensor histidine kinase NtrY [Asticcacaulis solisilvae]MDR6799335.1 two-component system nitrogen regulation sensor histidine kinase NtrY [Asticcacaulis sp. BE141]